MAKVTITSEVRPDASVEILAHSLKSALTGTGLQVDCRQPNLSTRSGTKALLMVDLDPLYRVTVAVPWEIVGTTAFALVVENSIDWMKARLRVARFAWGDNLPKLQEEHERKREQNAPAQSALKHPAKELPDSYPISNRYNSVTIVDPNGKTLTTIICDRHSDEIYVAQTE